MRTMYQSVTKFWFKATDDELTPAKVIDLSSSTMQGDIL